MTRGYKARDTHLGFADLGGNRVMPEAVRQRQASAVRTPRSHAAQPRYQQWADVIVWTRPTFARHGVEGLPKGGLRRPEMPESIGCN